MMDESSSQAKHYLVVSENYYGEQIRGVFSTRKNAQDYLDRRVKETDYKFDALVLEVVVDDPSSVKNVTVDGDATLEASVVDD